MITGMITGMTTGTATTGATDARHTGRLRMVLPLVLLACAPDRAGQAPSAQHPGAQDPGAADAHDHDAPAHSLDAFAAAYRQALTEAGRPPCTWQHESAALRCPDGSRHDLRGLYAVVQADPSPEARAAALLALVPSPAALPWETARPLLRPRLRAAAQGQAAVLAVDLELARPGGTLPVTAADLDAWQVKAPAAETLAVENLARVDPKPFWPLSEGAARARVGDGYDAERLLSAQQADLGFSPTHAVLVPGELCAVADPSHSARLDEMAAAWPGRALRLTWTDGAWR